MKNKAALCEGGPGEFFLFAQQFCNSLESDVKDVLEKEHPDWIVEALEVKQKPENGGFSLADGIRSIPAKLTIRFRAKHIVSEQCVDVDGAELARLDGALGAHFVSKKIEAVVKTRPHSA
jgi:hypothetical protein